MKTTTLISTGNFAAGGLPRRSVADGQFLNANDPAVLAITDFTRELPVTIELERQIDGALEEMIRLGVRALLVRKDQHIVGLVTSYDIQGERPMQFLQSSNYRHHSDVRVGDIMTTWNDLFAIQWETLQSLRAGELLHLLEGAGLTHALVVEAAPGDSACVVRALVSRARLSRQLSGMRRAG